jgi:O-methyltransferase involved in polyketide biosynthesis
MVSGITNREHVLLLIAGVLYYFDEAGLKQLFHEPYVYSGNRDHFRLQFKTGRKELPIKRSLRAGNA